MRLSIKTREESKGNPLSVHDLEFFLDDTKLEGLVSLKLIIKDDNFTTAILEIEPHDISVDDVESFIALAARYNK